MATAALKYKGHELKIRSFLSGAARAVLCATLLLGFQGGCTLFYGKPEPKSHGKRIRPSFAKQNAKKRIENSPAEVGVERYAQKSTRVEIVWIADTEADHFLLRYGPKPTELTKEALVEASALEKIEDPDKNQKFYRYILEEASPDVPLHVTVSSVKGDEVSPPSEVVEVGPVSER